MQRCQCHTAADVAKLVGDGKGDLGGGEGAFDGDCAAAPARPAILPENARTRRWSYLAILTIGFAMAGEAERISDMIPLLFSSVTDAPLMHGAEYFYTKINAVSNLLR